MELEPCCDLYPPSPPADLESAPAVEGVAGDAIVVLLNDIPTQIGLIGVDVPEAGVLGVYERQATAHEGYQSGQPQSTSLSLEQIGTAFVEELLVSRVVRLEFDQQRTDDEGRVLAYVWLYDGRLVNAEILREGYAQLQMMAPNVRYATLLRDCEQNAQEAGRGFWRP